MIAAGFLRAPILLLVAALPWCFGGVAPIYRMAAATVLAVCVFATLFRSTTAAMWRAVLLPLAVLSAAAALGLAQLSPTVAEFVARWNPVAVEIQRDFGATPWLEPEEITKPLSLHPPSTRRDLAALFTGLAAFALGAALFAETAPLLVLMSVAVVVGTAVAFFGLVQRLSWNGMIYWTEPTYGGQPFGPFINRNNAGGFLELTLAAGVGVLLWRLLAIPPLSDSRRSRRIFGPERPTLPRRVAWVFANLDASILAAAVAVLIISAGVLDSLSRGSFVAMTVGSVVALLLIALASRRTAFAWLLTGVVACGLGLTAWLGRNTALYERLATLGDPELLQHESRIQQWQASLETAQDFWLTGSGLGTYRYAYPLHREAATTSTALYAENQYLDAAVSGGVIGVTLLLLILAAFAFAVLRLLRNAQSSADYGIAATAVVLLTTQALHACFDFAMYVPAHFILFALFAGAMMGRAASVPGASRPRESFQVPGRFGRFAASAFGVLLVAALGFGIDELRRIQICRAAETATRLRVEDAARRDSEWVEQALEIQQRAVDALPDDVEVRTRLAELWVERYRTEFERGIDKMRMNPTTLLWAKPQRVFADAHLAARTWNDEALEAIRTNSTVRANLLPALIEARRARDLCPLSPHPQLLVATLCFLDESPLNDRFYLERLERLVGGREIWLFEIGALHLDAARPDAAFAAWRRCLELSSAHESQIIHFASGYLTPRRLLDEVIPDSPETIVRIARNYFKSDDQSPNRELFLERALELLSRRDVQSAIEWHLRGWIELNLQDWSAAATSLERATKLDPMNSEWHFEAATAYEALGDLPRAESHLVASLRLDADNADYAAALNRITAKLDPRDDDRDR